MYETMVHELGIQQFKAVLVLCVTVEKPNAAGAIIYASPFFRSQPMTVLNVSNIPDLLTAAFDGITAKVDAWVQGGSGWAVSNVKLHILIFVVLLLALVLLPVMLLPVALLLYDEARDLR